MFITMSAKEIDYMQILTDEDKVRIYFKKRRGKIVKFIVQYFSLINSKWRSILRIDTCHNYPHIHTYNLQKRESVIRLNGGLNIIFTEYKTYIIKNFGKIKENFIFSK